LTGRRGVSPTVRRRRLGAELRRYREAAGFTIDQVAERMDCSASKISRLETGQTGSSPRDVRDILALYQVGEAETEDLLEVAKETRQRGWWQRQGAVLTSAFIGFEAAAQYVRSYEAQCVPGLLQTEAYARELIAGGGNDNSEQIENRVRIRMARQTLLTQDDPLDFSCVLDEAVLLRPVGGREVMRSQLEHLAKVSSLDNITLQVLPLEIGAQAGMDGSFVLLRFPHEADPDTVYVTMATGGVFQEKPDDLNRYLSIFERLTGAALTPEDSMALILKMAKESG
jgi:transcriptional regulator with XRE-family HTH domain